MTITALRRPIAVVVATAADRHHVLSPALLRRVAAKRKAMEARRAAQLTRIAKALDTVARDELKLLQQDGDGSLMGHAIDVVFTDSDDDDDDQQK